MKSQRMLVSIFIFFGLSLNAHAIPMLSCVNATVDCAKQSKIVAPALANRIEECAELRECKTVCRTEKKVCKKGSREAKQMCIDECKTSGLTGANLRSCKKDCREGKREAKAQCRSDKKVCKNECRIDFKSPECVGARKAAKNAGIKGIKSCTRMASCIISVF